MHSYTNSENTPKNSERCWGPVALDLVDPKPWMFIPVHRQYPVPLVRQRPNWGDHLDLLGEFLLNLSQVFLPWSRLAGISSAWSCAHCVAHTFVAFVEHISLMTCTSMRACVCVLVRLFLYTHTHLFRTILPDSDMECILRAKTLQLYLTGMGR